MDNGLPEGFTSLLAGGEALKKNVNIMGVVVDVLPPKETRGTDWQISFTIQDEAGTSQRVKFFCRKYLLPDVRSSGDVVIIRDIKLNDWRGSIGFLSTWVTTWTVLHEADIPKEKPSGELNIPFSSCIKSKGHNLVPTQAQLDYAVTLCNSVDRSRYKELSEIQITSSSSSGPKHKFELIENIQENNYYTFVGQVVKSYQGDFNLTIYFTDFTNNKLLYNYLAPDSPESSSWKGPPGQFTLAVTLWDPHASWYRANVKTNDYVELRHVHIKLGKGDYTRLEGIIHDDKRFPNRVDISKVSYDEDSRDERVKDFLKRKRDYMEQIGDWVKPRNRKRYADEQTAPKTKAAIKRARQKERDRATKEQSKKGQQPTAEVGDEGIPPSRREVRIAEDRLNESIVCKYNEKPVRQLSSVLERSQSYAMLTPNGKQLIQPWQNLCRRVDVRVIDFFPPDLRDFAVREKVSEFDGLDEDEDVQATVRPSYADSESEGDVSDASSDQDELSEDREGSPATQDRQASIAKGYRYVWRFALLVQDRRLPRGTEPVRMVINVGGEEAIFLLDGLEPRDLFKAKNSQHLEQLRAKLFLLWGDLEERKQNPVKGQEGASTYRMLSKEELSEKPNSVPFPCLIQEYGVRLPSKVPAFERRFSIFGTKIK